MNIDQKEKRQFSRLLFSDENRISVILRSSDLSETSLKADIMNLSEGGIGLRFMEREAASVCEGENLYIAEISGQYQLSFLKTVETKVKWILEYKPSRGIRAGCEFMNFPEDTRNKIRTFINSQIEFKRTEK